MNLKGLWQATKWYVTAIMADQLPDEILHHPGVTDVGFRDVERAGRDMRRCVAYRCRFRALKGSIFCCDCIYKDTVSLSSRKPYKFPIDIHDTYKSIRSQLRVEFSRMRRRYLATTNKHWAV
jgi:hypothetical protein